jgi:hypothetical protein
LTVVKLGDPKATLPDTATLAEATEVQAGRRIVVAQPLVPVITATVPSPLIFPPGAEVRKVLIEGRNLQDITEVRVRKAEVPPRYKGNQGLLPFRRNELGIEVEIVTGSGTVPGSRYILDLMVKRYLAASAYLSVGYAAEIPPQKTMDMPEEPNVIPLVPAPGR